MGYRVVSATGEPRAVKLAQRLHPDAITLDLALPSLTGWNLLASIKGDAELSGTPVIVLLVVDESAGVTLGATDYLTKPVQQDRLVAMLRTHCRDLSAPVLVVDDDPATREVLQRMLEPGGSPRRCGRPAGPPRPGGGAPPLAHPPRPAHAPDERVRVPRRAPVPAGGGRSVVVVTAKDLTAEATPAVRPGRRGLRKGAYARERLPVRGPRPGRRLDSGAVTGDGFTERGFLRLAADGAPRPPASPAVRVPSRRRRRREDRRVGRREADAPRRPVEQLCGRVRHLVGQRVHEAVG